LQHQADLAGLARTRRRATGLTTPGGTTLLTEHQHPPGHLDPGHCQDRARETGLLDHCHRVQRQEQAFSETRRWARQARRNTTWALGSPGIGIPLAAIALLTG
jgi:hypothetical protein